VVRQLRAGSTGGPLVVFLHGMEDTWRSWDPLARKLDPGWRVCALDPPWRAGGGHQWRHGSTPGRWLSAALRTLARPVDLLVGHSLGANAVLEALARSRTVRPAGALLLAPFYCPPELDITWRVFEQAQRDFRQIIREGLEVRLGPRAARIDAPLMEAMLSKLVDRIGPTGFTALFDQFLATAELTLASVRVPMRVVAGDRDPALDGFRAAALSRRLPRACVVTEPGFDHFCQVRQVDAVARHVTDFLAEIGQESTRKEGRR
jgi:pimeloyl-ACP methyl ester carboxylesterase